MDIRDLDLNLLRVLDALIEEGTITRAARRLRLAQPTVSAALRRLRLVLGDELFVRVDGIMQPTARALAVKDVVSSVLKTIRLEILSQAAFDPSLEVGTITLSLSDIGELEFLPKLYERIAHEAPNVTVRSVIANPTDLAVAMDLGNVDLAMGYFPDLTTSLFKQQSLFKHKSACLVRRDHPTLGANFTLEDYLAAKHIAIAQEGRFRDVVEVGLAAQGLERRIGIQTPHFVSVPFLVAQSDLVATVPYPLAVQFAGLCNLRIVDPPFAIPLIEVKQVWHKRFDGHPRLRWLRQLVAETSQNRPHMGIDPGPLPVVAAEA